MTHDDPRARGTPVGVWIRGIAVSGFLVLAAASPAEGQLSPGPLARPHATLEGATNCVKCHVPGGAGYEKSGLRMDNYEGLMKGTKFGPVVVPGSSVGSTLYRLVSGQADPSIRMPHGQASLPDADIATIATWIDQGAKN